MDNICQQILPISNTRLRGIDLSLDSTCHEVLMLWMTNARHWFIMRTLHDIDQSPFSMLYIYNTFYSLILHGTFRPWEDVRPCQLRWYITASNSSTKTTLFTSSVIILTRQRSPTSKANRQPTICRGHDEVTSIIMTTDDTMDVGMTVLRWFLTVQ